MPGYQANEPLGSGGTLTRPVYANIASIAFFSIAVLVALNVESAKMLLAKHGYPTVPVEASTTPYRG